MQIVDCRIPREALDEDVLVAIYTKEDIEQLIIDDLESQGYDISLVEFLIDYGDYTTKPFLIIATAWNK